VDVPVDVPVDVTASVVDLARRLGLTVEEPVPLRSTNNVVMWLRPSAVVAKISVGHRRAQDELAIAGGLAHAGAPVVAPAEGVGLRVHRISGHGVTFWTYAPQHDVADPDAESVAEALWALHAALATLGATAPSRTYEEQITDTVGALDRPDFAPLLRGHDRRLLRSTLEHGRVILARTADRESIIHGSPHRLNIVVVAGSPRFIDFETVRYGPREWDLAHLEPEVAGHYPGVLDPEVLAVCRLLVSATTSAWCFDGVGRGPDMRDHAQHHLATVRSAVG
jgi:hypothetical protein